MITNSSNKFNKIEKVVTPKEFVRMATLNPNAIKSSTFLPPKIGKEGDFGRFKVRMK